MEKGELYTNELFNQFPEESQSAAKTKAFSDSKAVFSLNFTPENLLFIIIGFILVIAVSFSLGVEKGKKIVYKPRAQLSRAVVKKEIQKAVEAKTEIKRVDQAPVAKVEEKQQPQTAAKYTIQVVTHTKPDLAKKEMAFLSTEGYKAYLSVINGFYVVYVGSYDNKEEAALSLKKLQKRYKDCFVKKAVI